MIDTDARVPPAETPVTTLVSGILDDAQKLAKQQIEMLKAEVREDFRRSKRAAEFGGMGVVLLTVGFLGLVMALAYFLHGQARFAAGQYAEAAARIRDGLARDAKWPQSAFDPTELYGERPERFFAHRTALKKALAENPGQVTLEFLLGYQLWFSGEKAEADKLFRAAEKRLAAPGQPPVQQEWTEQDAHAAHGEQQAGAHRAGAE